MTHSKSGNRSVKSSDLRDENESPPTSPTSRSAKANDPARVVFLGSAQVGKTSIIQRFIHNRFDEKYIPTVEEMYTKKYLVKNRLVPLVLVDTSGSFDFPAMLRLWIAKAHAFVIVFSHEKADSLAQAGNLLAQIKMHRKDYAPLASVDFHVTGHQPAERPRFSSDPQKPDSGEVSPGVESFSSLSLGSPPITVVCNKSDLPASHSRVSEGAIMEWLLANGLKPSQFVYASAKANESIEAVFKSLWDQNEISQAIRFSTWESVKHSSFISHRPSQTTMTGFSALSDVVATTNGSGGTSATTSTQNSTSPSGTGSGSRSRSAFFRNSLRLNRGASGKANRAKSDVIQLDCTVS